MNLVYDVRLKTALCPKCYGPAHWDENGNLQCEWEECGYIYTMFEEDKKVNIFQLELGL